MAEPPCTVDPDSWFPPFTKEDIQRAVTICRSNCHMIEECRQLADTVPGAIGIWGGELRKGRYWEYPTMRKDVSKVCPQCHNRFTGHQNKVYCKEACRIKARGY
jgi:hypothetical protein